MKFIISLLTILITISLINTCNDVESAKIQKVYRQHLDSLQAIDKVYKKKLAAYERTNKHLQVKLTATDSLLTVEKNKIVVLKKSINNTVNYRWKNNNDNQENRLAECDSLKENIVKYVVVQDKIDTLTGEKLTTLTDLLIEKDHQINDCHTAYEKMKATLAQSIQDNELTTQQLVKSDRKLKRKVFLNKALGTGAAILATIAATLILVN